MNALDIAQRSNKALNKQVAALRCQLGSAENEIENLKAKNTALTAQLKIPVSATDSSTIVTVEIEKTMRSANAGEWVFTAQGLFQCPGFDANRYRGYVVRRFIK
ncbi:MAG TPA: hypothetical protein VL866_24165 [Pyrinomonadaceae bacterium]|nr:hypothetical protein [Pyrinomonadaceae bacterium]